MFDGEGGDGGGWRGGRGLGRRVGLNCKGRGRRCGKHCGKGSCGRAVPSLECDVGSDIWREVQHAVVDVLRHLHDLQVALVQQVVDVEAGAGQAAALGFNTDGGVEADVAEGVGGDAEHGALAFLAQEHLLLQRAHAAGGGRHAPPHRLLALDELAGQVLLHAAEHGDCGGRDAGEGGEEEAEVGEERQKSLAVAAAQASVEFLVQHPLLRVQVNGHDEADEQLVGVAVRLLDDFPGEHFRGLDADFPAALRFHLGRKFGACVDDVLNACGCKLCESLAEPGDGHQDVAVFDIVLAHHSAGELKNGCLITTGGGGHAV